MSLAILIPAAGQSTRMRGRDKLLEDVDGQPLLVRQVTTALGLNVPVLVTLPEPGDTRSEALSSLHSPMLSTCHLPDAVHGLSASMRAGARWAQATGKTALMVFLPDLPDLTKRDLETLKSSHEKAPDLPVRAADMTGQLGHPTVIPTRLFSAMIELRGDVGAQALLAQETVLPCPLAGMRATTDLDTPEDWETWRITLEKSNA